MSLVRLRRNKFSLGLVSHQNSVSHFFRILGFFFPLFLFFFGFNELWLAKYLWRMTRDLRGKGFSAFLFKRRTRRRVVVRLLSPVRFYDYSRRPIRLVFKSW